MIEIITLCFAAAAFIMCVVLFFTRQSTEKLEKKLLEEMRLSRQETNSAVAEAVRNAAVSQIETQQQIATGQNQRIKELTEQLSRQQQILQRTVTDQMTGLDERFKAVAMQNEVKLENIRLTMEKQLSALQSSNEKKLDEMRSTVDEKLQKTLNERINHSFGLVNERLEQVYKGLGEMQTLAIGVGDLKKVLSNVKTRGILGEIQLGAILEEILSPEQYAANVATVKGSSERVEYAVKMPGEGSGESVWLPIDAKFPSDAYANLLEAYDSGDSAAVEATGKILDARIKSFAKDIKEKYVHVPDTTEFAIMFLPVEGLYAEVVRRGLVEKLQKDYRVNIAGPTTMAALLNSLQMGFRTLAIQRRSGEVWQVLGDVKSEFMKFETLLERAKKNIESAGKNIDELSGVRTRAIVRKLRDVTSLEQGEEQEDSLPFAEERLLTEETTNEE